MSDGAHALEHAEHTAHAGHDHGHGPADNLGARIGITMALLGVVLALCGALLGAARTEVIAVLTNQNIAQTKFQGNAARFRTVRTQLAALNATTPPDAEVKAAREGIAALEASTDPTVKAQATLAKALLRAAEPDPAAMRRMIRITKKFRRERDAAGTWSDSYLPIAQDYFFAAEHYELGQIAAEVGIILASIALLRKNRNLWYMAMLLGAVSVGIAGWTRLTMQHNIGVHEATMEKAQEHFFELKKAQDESADDDAAIASAVARFPAVAGEAVDYEDEGAAKGHEHGAAPAEHDHGH